MRNFKGMTLMEMLVALGIFSFMFIFITQTVKQSRRQVQKMTKNIHKDSSFNHVIDLIKRDFSSVGFFFDINDNFRKNFPLSPRFAESQNEALPSALGQNQESSSSKEKPLFMSPYFVFRGEEDEVEFVSYALKEDFQEDSLKQWMQIRYFIQDCPNSDNSFSSCLMRSTQKYWNLEEDRESEEALVLFRDFKSLKFSYLTQKTDEDEKWEDSWRAGRSLSRFAYPQEMALPFRVKLELEAQEEEFIWSFPVGNFYLNAWNPFSKEFFNFKKWELPKKKAPAQKAVRVIR